MYDIFASFIGCSLFNSFIVVDEEFFCCNFHFACCHVEFPVLVVLVQNHLEFTRNVDVTTYEDGVRKTHNLDGRATAPAVWDFYKARSF